MDAGVHVLHLFSSLNFVLGTAIRIRSALVKGRCSRPRNFFCVSFRCFCELIMLFKVVSETYSCLVFGVLKSMFNNLLEQLIFHHSLGVRMCLKCQACLNQMKPSHLWRHGCQMLRRDREFFGVGVQSPHTNFTTVRKVFLGKPTSTIVEPSSLQVFFLVERKDTSLRQIFVVCSRSFWERDEKFVESWSWGSVYHHRARCARNCHNR